MKNKLIVFVAKLSGWFISTFKLGSGSTWPGHIALKLNKNFIKEILSSDFPQLDVVIIAGTNGKTTTSKLLRFLLEKQGKKVFQNEEGANLLNGIASSLLRHTALANSRSSKYDVAIFEVDENSLPLVLAQVKPKAVVLLNLFRDQLDRYGEVNIIAGKWEKSLAKLSRETHLILNGDDPQIYYLGKKSPAQIHYYGLEDLFFKIKEIPHDVDSTYCPQCGEQLVYKGISYSHLGDFYCKSCGFKRENVETFQKKHIRYSLLGVYNIYNAYAVILTLEKALGIRLDTVDLDEFKPAFGRQERLEYKGRNIFIQLSKNPAGFNQSVEVAREVIANGGGNILIVLNDRIPDGRDISWIWDVEFERIKDMTDTVYVSGDRAFDMGVRMKYTGIAHVQVSGNLEKAIEEVVDKTQKGKNVIILATYSAMLETREILIGRKLL